MLFDTDDVLIWYLRGNQKAASVLSDADTRKISVVTYMELLQGARDKNEIRVIRGFLKDYDFETIPLTENIGHRASVYMEQYCLKIGMCMADALLAATTVENGLVLCTANNKHYKSVGDIEINVFRP